MLGTAIEYARRGWIIHRIHSPDAKVNSPGKQPLDAGWQKVITPPDEAALKTWFGSDNPNGYNIGLLCGEASGITVIDLDRMIYADIFAGVKTLRSTRTTGRGHIFFKFHHRLKASKHHNLGIEVLSTGNNVILPPSRHTSGDEYQWVDQADDVVDMPDEVVVKLNNLFQREKGLNALVKKCRPCFSKLWKKEIREVTDFHGAEGRELMLAWGTDLKAAGATLADGEMWAKVIYGEDHDAGKTLTEWRNIDPAKTWMCKTIADKLGGVIECDCAGCKWKSPQTSPKKGVVSPDTFLVGDKQAFDTNMFAKWLLDESGERFITLTDNDRIYRYSDGVYIPSGETFIKKSVEQIMDGVKVTTYSVNEILSHIRRRTFAERDEFDSDLDVINMRNGLYHIKAGEFEQHTPDYLSLSKMGVKYDPEAECKEMDRFINDVVEPHRVDAIYEIAGYAILPEKRLKRGVIFVGEPDTGKSTMIDIISALVGETRISDVSPIAFADDNHASFDLFGMFLNRIDDLGTTPIVDTGVLKSIISSAPIRANQKYGKPFSFIPNAMILFGCNLVPMCSDMNLMDKFDILMFKNVHRGKDIDLDMPKKLTTDTEMSGLFNKAMAAVKTAIKNRTFTGSYTLYDRQKDYEYHSNPLARFVGECCDLSDHDAVTDKKLFRKIYVEWSKQHDFTIVTVGAQTTYLQDKGIMLSRPGHRDERVEIYTGLCILPWGHGGDMAGSQEETLFFQEQEVESGMGSWGHSTSLRDSKNEVKERMGCDTRPGLKTDSKTRISVVTPTRYTCDTQSNQMKNINWFFREHMDSDNKTAPIGYASREQLVEYVPDVAEQLHINKDVAFRLVMQYGKDRGWI